VSEINGLPAGGLRNLSDLVSIEDAAAELGIEPKRLRGFVMRNELGDPIGDLHRVYWGSLAETRARLIGETLLP
jgi:hypothetical protein